MLKILIKRQLLEIAKGFFINNKTGEKRNKIGVFFTGFGFALVMLLIGGMFALYAYMMGLQFINSGYTWLYFAIFLLASVLIGVLGSVFSTYATLYLAKDNDLLIAMPIKPHHIILSRLFTVLIISALYTSIMFLPVLIIYYSIARRISILSAIFSALILPLLILFVITLSCVLGYLVAKISTKIKNKSLVTTIVSLLFFALIYYVSFNMGNSFAEGALNGAVLGGAIKTYAYPMYMIGEMAEGNILYAVILTTVIVGLFVLVFLIIKRNFFKLATFKSGAVKSKRKSIKMNASGSGKALLKKEFKRYFSSANYILNSSIYVVFLPIIAILLLVNMDIVRELIYMLGSMINFPIELILIAFVLALSAMNNSAASSISLEGKHLWLLQSLPVKTHQIVNAKAFVQIIITLPLSFISMACVGIVLELEPIILVLTLILDVVFVAFMAYFDLLLNVLRPSFSWTNEIYVIKQSLPVFLSLFIGWIILLALGGICALIVKAVFMRYALVICLSAVLAICLALLAIVIILCNVCCKKLLY